MYCPVELVCVSEDCPVATFLTEIFALATTAPAELVTVPESVAREAWARSGPEIARQRARIPRAGKYCVFFGFI